MDFEQAPWDDAVSIGPAKQEEAEGKGVRKERARVQRTTSAQFENLDVDAGPLGPLSARPESPVEAAPAPSHSPRPLPSANVRQEARERDSERGQRSKPPVKAPKFDITVGDPHKIGDITSAHTVYKVTTRTDSKAFRSGEFSVTRRYRDFRWLYDTLNTNNPGIVIPPPPDKQAMGRFGEDFVETRRMALERMLQKCVTHPTLQHDGDLKIFLESEAFHVDVKQKERERSGSLEGKSGFMSSLGAAVPTMPSFGGSGKFVEHDEWFHERKITLDALENQLKGLNKAVDGVMKQRRELADATGEFGAALSRVAATELTFSLSTAFSLLSGLQFRIKELQERQTLQELLTIGTTVDEYLRLVDSAKVAIGQRQKAYFTWQGAEADLVRRKAACDKMRRSGKTQQDRMAQMSAELGEVERKCHQLRLQFEDMGRLLKQELARIDTEKVEDFKSSIETFLESVVEGQKEVRCFACLPMLIPSSLNIGRPFSCALIRRSNPSPNPSRLLCKPHIMSTLRRQLRTM